MKSWQRVWLITDCVNVRCANVRKISNSVFHFQFKSPVLKQVTFVMVVKVLLTYRSISKTTLYLPSMRSDVFPLVMAMFTSGHFPAEITRNISSVDFAWKVGDQLG